jgi:hypothetical protein
MYSDNGTNFVGAAAELKRCLDSLSQDQIMQFLSPQHIEWHFNPPAAPNFGGAWESLVKSVKTTLKTVLSTQLVPESVLRTALIEVEAVVNSRPLTYNSTDVNDLTALTLNHFLIGRAENPMSPDVVQDREINSRRRWRQVQVVANHVCSSYGSENIFPP